MANPFDQFDSPVASGARDVGTALALGANDVVGIAGNVAKIISGKENFLTKKSKEISEALQAQKSPELLAAEQDRDEAVAEEPSLLYAIGTYVAKTATNPRLFTTTVAQIAPSSLGPGVVGAGAKMATGKLLAKKGTEFATKVGLGTAIGTGVAMQAGDVAGQQMDELMRTLEGMDDQTAMQIPQVADLVKNKGYTIPVAKASVASYIAMQTALGAGTISALTQLIPGAQTIEKAIVGGAEKAAGKTLLSKAIMAGKGAVKSAAGETTQEVSEEGGGQVLANVLARPVEPERELTAGVAPAVGQAIVGAGALGAAAGAKIGAPVSRPEPTPRPVSEGEAPAGMSGQPPMPAATRPSLAPEQAASLERSEEMTPEQFFATVNIRQARLLGGEPNAEDVALVGEVPPPRAVVSPETVNSALDQAYNALNAWKRDNPNAPENIVLIFDPEMMHNGYGIQGAFNPKDGTIFINTAFTPPERLGQIVSHEWAHATLATPEGQKAFADFALREIPQADLDALATRYGTQDRMVLLEEWIAENQEKAPGVISRIVARIREWLANFGIVNLNDGEVADIMLRTLREQAEGRVQPDVDPTAGGVQVDPNSEVYDQFVGNRLDTAPRYSLQKLPAAGDVVDAKGNLKYTIPQKTLNVSHYSRIPELTVIDPAFYGTGAGEHYHRMMKGIDKSFFFVGNSKPRRGENVSGEGMTRYQTTIDSSRIYDIDKDPLDLWFATNPQKSEGMLKELGYDGFFAKTNDGRSFVAMFYPVDVETGQMTREAAPVEEELPEAPQESAEDYIARVEAEEAEARRKALRRASRGKYSLSSEKVTEPTSRTETSGIMASPSIVDIQYDRAKKNLDSSEQARFKSVISDYASGAKVYDAIGDWRDGAENSVAAIYEGPKSPDELKQIAAKAGLAGTQKNILWWTADSDGADAIHQIFWPKDVSMDEARQAMIDVGLENRTLIQTPDGVRGLVFDGGKQNLNKIEALHEHPTQPSLDSHNATGAFLGADWSKPEEERAPRAYGFKAYRRVLGSSAKTKTGEGGRGAEQRAGILGEPESETRFSLTERVAQGRDTVLATEAQKLKRGETTPAKYARKVEQRMPLRPFDEVPQPANDEDILRGLGNRMAGERLKRELKANPEDIEGQRVEARLDIPSYEDANVWIVTLHNPRESSAAAGKVLAYTPTAILRDVTFTVNQTAAMNVAAGARKSSFATMDGTYVPATARSAYDQAVEAKESGDWVEIGMNPIRHSYFYDKSDQRPVVSADEVIQVGGLVLGRGVQYGEKSDYKFSLAQTKTPEFKKWFGDSKVVDEQGEPLVVYHGTDQDITKFRPGSYVTDNPEYASEFGDRVMPVYVAVKKIKTLMDEDFRLLAGRPKEFQKYIDQGYDALTTDNGGAWIIFDPTKIKSATGNKGTFDPTNPDIRYSLAQTRTPEFKKWFGDSQIVDADGNPQVMYHGTFNRLTRTGPWDLSRAEDFTIFRPRVQAAGENLENEPAVIFASPNPQLASEFSGVTPSMLQEESGDTIAEKRPGARVYPVYVKAENPFDYENPRHIQQLFGDEDYIELIPGSEEGGPYGSLDYDGVTVDRSKVESGNWADIEYLLGRIKNEGFDGAFVSEEDTESQKAKNIAVFNSDQIKSATGNVGAFGQRPLTAEERERLGVTEEEAAEGQKRGDIRMSLTGKPLGKIALEDAEKFRFKNQKEVSKYLGELLKKDAPQGLDDRTPETLRALAELMDRELSLALTMPKNADAIGWYSREMDKVFEILRSPELDYQLDDPLNRGVFYALLAITSNGQKVVPQFLKAAELYEGWRKTGKIPPVGKWGGERSRAIKGHVKFLNQMLEAVGPEQTLGFLTSDQSLGDHLDNLYGMVAEAQGLPEKATVKEKKAAIRKHLNAKMPGGELVDYNTVGAIVFGPKLGGGFFANLYGKFDRLTMDRWFMRTFHRLTGRLGEDRPEMVQSIIKEARMEAADVLPEDISDEEILQEITTTGKQAFKDYKEIKRRLKQDPNDSEAYGLDVMRRLYNRYLKAKSGLYDAPDNGSHRKFIREVMEEVQKLRAERGEEKIDTSDIQASLWYLEKNIWDDLRKSMDEDAITEADSQQDEDEGEDEDTAGRVSYSDGARELYRRKTRKKYDDGDEKPKERVLAGV